MRQVVVRKHGGSWRLRGRVLLPWLVGLVVWVAVGWWLDPHPRWRIPFATSGPYTVPVGEDEAGERIVAWEAAPMAGTTGTTPQALLILDARTGAVLHRLAASPFRFESASRGSAELFQPRFRGDAVWRVVETKTPEGMRLELRGWRYAHEQAERTVRVWEIADQEQFRLDISPGRSGVLVVQRPLPWEISFGAQLTPAASPLVQGMTAAVVESESGTGEWIRDQVSPLLCQAYGLPDKVEEPLKVMGRWCTPAFRAPQAPRLSPDGQLAAIPDAILPLAWAVGTHGDKMPAETFGPVGQNTSKGIDAPLQAAPTGALVYDVQTGELLHRAEPRVGAARGLQWAGPYLLVEPVQGYLMTNRRPPNLAEPQGGLSWGIRYSAKIFTKADDVRPVFNGRTGRRVYWPDDFHLRDPSARCALHPQNPNLLLAVARGTGEFSPEQELKLFVMRSPFRNNRMSMVRNIRIPVVSRNGGTGWRMFPGVLAVTESDDAMPEWLHSLVSVNATVERWARGLWPGETFRVTLFDWMDEEVLWQRRGAALWEIGEYQQLMLVGLTVDADGRQVPTFVENWELPVTVHSAWWSRGAGLGAVVVVITAQFLCAWWRGRRRKQEVRRTAGV